MQRARSFHMVVLVFSLAIAMPSAFAQVLIATVPVENGPYATDVNSVTNKTYVANFCGTDPNCLLGTGTVTVIDGATFATQSVTAGFEPYALAVNSVTNKIYVANYCGNDLSCQNGPGTVTVIDGATLSAQTVTVGTGPRDLAVNSVTNKIYVVNVCGSSPSCNGYRGPGTVTVIDGATLSTQTVAVGIFSKGVAVDSVTNKIYATSTCGNDSSCQSPGTVTVIDGATLSTQTVTAGYYPKFVAANSATNKIYVVNGCGDVPNCHGVVPGTVTVIDGATLSTQTVAVGDGPNRGAVNPITNKIYVYNICGNDPTCNSAGTVTVIDGATNNTTTVNVGLGPSFIAADVVTNEIYVANGGDDTVTVIDGVTNNTVPVSVGYGPDWVAINATTDRIYVPNNLGASVSVIAGDTKLQLVNVAPCRLVDTRPQYGGNGPIQGGTFQSFPIPQEGGCNIPTTAVAYSLNVSVVPSGPLGYLTIWPTGEYRPGVATLNSLDGRIKADAAIVSGGVGGAVSVYVTNTTNVVLDINGYFAPVSGSTLAFYPLTPCRIADTRNSSFPQGLGPPFLPGHQERDFPILNATSCNIPGSAAAYSLNFSVVPHGGLGYLTVWPTGQTRPLVSTLNDVPGTIIANAAIVPVGTSGDISVYPSNDTDVIIDINGYFAPAGPGGLSLYPAPPCRVVDTRQLGPPFSGTLTPPVDVVHSVCEPPVTAQAYVFNATVVPTGALGYLTLWPDGTNRPTVSTLNALDGSITNNMAIVPSTNGKVDAFASGLTQLILDISSYFAP
jgi:DNA-binding beta-propeller fold protein YncE